MWAAIWFGQSSTFSFTQHIRVPLEREALADLYGAVKNLSCESTSECSPFFTATKTSQGSPGGASLGKHAPSPPFHQNILGKITDG